MTRRVLITGGAGFIGSRLTAALISAGDEVSVLDVASPEADVPHLRCSVMDFDALVELTRRELDAVVHLAGYVREGVNEAPHAGASLQLQGTLNVLEACRRNRIPHLALASSLYVYSGYSAEDLVDESTVLDPRETDLFGGGKLTCEALCNEFSRRYGLRTSSFRFGPIYGGRGSSAVDEFMRRGQLGERISVWGRGLRRNQYTFIDDAVEAVGRGLRSAGEVPSAETYNVISPEAVSMVELADLLRAKFGFEIEFDPTRPEGPALPYISSEKAAVMLGWESRTLAAGLDAMSSLRGG